MFFLRSLNSGSTRCSELSRSPCILTKWRGSEKARSPWYSLNSDFLEKHCTEVNLHLFVFITFLSGLGYQHVKLFYIAALSGSSPTSCSTSPADLLSCTYFLCFSIFLFALKFFPQSTHFSLEWHVLCLSNRF